MSGRPEPTPRSATRYHELFGPNASHDALHRQRASPTRSADLTQAEAVRLALERSQQH